MMRWVAVVGLLTAVRAFAQDDGGAADAGWLPLPDLVAASPDPTYAALPEYARSCSTIVTNALALKKPCELDVVSFCKDPLLAQNIPKLTDIQAVQKDECPVSGDSLKPETATIQTDVTPFSTSWQQDVITGVASFLASRAKAEAIASLVEDMKDDVCKNDEGKRLFPSTCTLLQGDDTGSPAWSVLKAAFEADFNELPYNFGSVLAAGNRISQDRAELLIAPAAVLQHVLLKGEDAVFVLGGLADRYAAVGPNCKERPAGCFFLVEGIVIKILEPGIHQATGLSEDQWKRYTMIAARWYLPGALKNAKILSGTFDYKSGAPVLDSFVKALSTVKPVASDIAGETPDQKQRRTDKLTQGLQALMFTSGLVGAIVPQLKDEDGKAVKVALAGLRILADARAAVRTKEYARLLTDLLSFGVALGGALDAPTWFIKYASFMADVASAKTSDDVQRALEAAASPIDAWKHKREKGHHVFAIQGYVGAQGGGEVFLRTDLAPGPAPQFSLFGPVGVEGAWALGDGGVSLGAFVSIIDVGALIDFRASTDNVMGANGTSVAQVDPAPTFGFAQVFSPGAYLVMGVTKSFPLVFGIGAALEPQLRRVTFVGSPTSTNVSAVRFGAFLAIDVTIFEL
jgi:hypothetical protein